MMYCSIALSRRFGSSVTAMPRDGFTLHVCHNFSRFLLQRGSNVVLHVSSSPNDSIDTILVPGLGFTQNGERLGRGGGYYDKFLATCKSRTKLIGICFKEQIINNLPREKHDRLVTNIVTA